ncbi:MAG: replication-associated recombination protein A [Calditrichaeota bacterium]|nr:replication-associated recombination protein A [Calditrichota bacterium]
MDLFSQNATSSPPPRRDAPLAERCRPRRLDDFVGHEAIVGPGTVLREEIRHNRLKSLILWGPPGVGKTTLARIIAQEVQADFIALSAVTAGVADVRKVIDRAEKNRKYLNKTTILFIDEIHRFNKAQQDALLHAVEDGTLILIGATTENPSFEVIPPLLSRCQVYQMHPLRKEDIRRIVERALAEDEVLKPLKIEIQDWDTLLQLAAGDARRALNILEKAAELHEGEIPPVKLTRTDFEKAALQKTLYYDKAGEMHYDVISAFIKSLRGSDPDAAIFWMARMLAAGEDPKFIARRMLILAAEDIGNADPYALTLATSCFTAVTYIGMPEAQIILSQVAAYLAAAPKSNAAIVAINKALEDVRNHPDVQVPLALRNAPTTLLADLGYGKDYQYAHDYPGHFVRMAYLPPELQGRIYYRPGELGKEKEIRKRLMELWGEWKDYSKTEKPSKSKKSGPSR